MRTPRITQEDTDGFIEDCFKALPFVTAYEEARDRVDTRIQELKDLADSEEHHEFFSNK